MSGPGWWKGTGYSVRDIRADRRRSAATWARVKSGSAQRPSITPSAFAIFISNFRRLRWLPFRIATGKSYSHQKIRTPRRLRNWNRVRRKVRPASQDRHSGPTVERSHVGIGLTRNRPTRLLERPRPPQLWKRQPCLPVSPPESIVFRPRSMPESRSPDPGRSAETVPPMRHASPHID